MRRLSRIPLRFIRATGVARYAPWRLSRIPLRFIRATRAARYASFIHARECRQERGKWWAYWTKQSALQWAKAMCVHR